MFDGRIFVQKCGIPMGKIYAPALANMYLVDFDKNAIQGFNGVLPIAYFRFLDDIFFVWPGTINQLIEFQNYLNSIISGITITLTSHLTYVNFLDTTVFKCYSSINITLLTRVYFKPTDTHQLLHFSSFHPRHIQNGVVKSQVLRFKRISKTFFDFENSCRILFAAIIPRGYNARSLRRIKNDMWSPFGTVESSVGSKQQKNTNLFPIVLPYNSLTVKIITKWIEICKKNTSFKHLRFIAAYSNNTNLSGKLVKSKL